MDSSYNVQSLRHMVPMLFRLTDKKALSLRNISKDIQSKIKSPKKTLSKEKTTEQAILKLKFCEEMSQNHLIIGNQYQLNLLTFSGVTSEYADINSEWTLAFTEKITGLFIAHKLHKLFVTCSNCLYCYGYRDDSIETPPIFYQKITLKEPIKAIYIPKKDFLLIFREIELSVFEMYNPHGMFEFKEVARKIYRKSDDGLQFFGIPNEKGFSFTVFLYLLEQNDQEEKIDLTDTLLEPKEKLTLFTIRMAFDRPNDIKINPLSKFCQISIFHRDIQTLSIRHYQEDIYLVEIGLSIMALRHNYIIDEITFHSSKNQSYIKLLTTSSFFHFENDTFDRYFYFLNEEKPQKFNFNCIDSLHVTVPEKSQIFSIKKMGEKLFFIYQKSTAYQANQLDYWIGISDSIKKEQKIKEIFPEKLSPQEELGTESIDLKVKAACKIGFTKSQAYYELWKRSAKSTKKNYQLLIATQNFTIIREQLQKKFRVHSLSYQQVFMILISSLAMLKQKIAQSCSFDVIKQYSMCHFLICKIEMFEKTMRNTSQNSGEDINISIQDYYYLNQIELQHQLFKLLNEYLIQRKPVEIKIRALLSQFSLIFRMLYPTILPKIVEQFLDHFKELITVIPEILPLEGDSHDIKNGIWTDIDLNTTQSFFILEHIQGLETNSFIKDFVESNFYKKYQWNFHGAICKSISTIKQQLKKHDINFIFTQLFATLHLQKEQIKNEKRKKSRDWRDQSNSSKKQIITQEVIDDIVSQIEKCELLPTRLRGKFTFYSQLYKRFNNFYCIDKKEVIGAINFFSLGQDELFRLYFLKERAQKGIFILKQIKPIYQKSTNDGITIFLRNMFNFFKSEESSWSDLKIILNKFNNQKEDFYYSNQDIVDVLIKAIMEKIYIGTPNFNQLDLGEVMLYIQNIPIEAKDSELLSNLIAIRDIYYEQDLLKEIKINMSLREIVDRGQQVLFKLMENEIKKYKVMQITDPSELKIYAYNIIFGLNEKKCKIYLDKHKKFLYKAFLIIVMQKEQFVLLCSDIIKDPYLINQFEVDDNLIQNIVLYLYKKKGHSEQSEPNYINNLISFLNPSNNKAKFIVLTQAFGKIFKLKQFKIKYPYFINYYPNSQEICAIVNSLSREDVKTIDYIKLFDIAYMLKMLGETYQNIKATTYLKQNETFQRKCKFKLQVFIIFFIKFLREELFQKALQIAKLILKINNGVNRISNIIFPVFLLEKIKSQLLMRVQEPIIKLISYFFYEPSSLLYIISQLTNPQTKFTNNQIDEFVDQKLNMKKQELTFDPENAVFSDAFKQIISKMSQNEQVKTINPLLQNIWKQISQNREDFSKNTIYLIIYRILLHDPLTLAQYIYRKHKGINVKSLRALITLLSFQSCFDMNHLFQVGQSIFEVLYTRLSKSKPNFEKEENNQSFIYTQEYLDNLTKVSAEDLVGSSIAIMKQKSEIHFCYPHIEKAHQTKVKEIQTMIKNPNEYQKQKAEELDVLHQRLYPKRYSKIRKQEILNEVLNRQDQQLRYPFDDDDLEYSQAKYDLTIDFITYEPTKVQFNEIEERSQIIKTELYHEKQTYKDSKRSNPEAASEFEQLYVEIFKQKIKNSEEHFYLVRKPKHKSVFVQKQDQQNKFKTLFEQKCIEGGFLSMMKKKQCISDLKRKKKLISVAMPTELQKPLDESQILSESQNLKQSTLCIDYLDLSSQLELFCNENTQFFSFVPMMKEEKEKNRFFKEIVKTVYLKQERSFAKRVDFLWLLKVNIFGQKEVDGPIRAIVQQVSRSELLHDLFTPIEAIISEELFCQKIDLASALKLIKKNIKEQVYLLEDYIKLAQLIGQAFNSKDEEEEIKISFIVKECKKLLLKDSLQIQQDVKEMISNIHSEMLDKYISDWKKSQNEQDKLISAKLEFLRSSN